MKSPNQSQTRQKVYDVISSVIERNLTPEEHNKVRDILKEYLKSCSEYSELIKANEKKPTEHVLICGKCNKKVHALGYDERKKARRTFVSE